MFFILWIILCLILIFLIYQLVVTFISYNNKKYFSDMNVEVKTLIKSLDYYLLHLKEKNKLKYFNIILKLRNYIFEINDIKYK